MPQKSKKNSALKALKPIDPRYQKFARFVTEIVEQSGLSTYAFSQRYKVANSSLREMMQGRYFPHANKLAGLAEALSAASGKSITPGQLTDLVEKGETPEPLPKEERDTMRPSTVLWHLQRLTTEERRSIWPGILKLATSDLTDDSNNAETEDQEAEKQLHPLLQVIKEQMQTWGISKLSDFFDEVLDKNDLKATHKHRKELEDLLPPDIEIEDQEIGPNWDVEHPNALILLASVLLDGRFQPADLSHYLVNEFGDGKPSGRVGRVQ